MTGTFKLTDRQRRGMFARLKPLGMGIEDLRDMVEAITGQRSISSLTKVGGAEVIDELDKLQRETRSAKPHPSAGQMGKIYKLGYLLRWNSTTIRKFNRRTTGKWDIHDDTPKEASKLILAMEGVLASEKQPA